MRLIVITILALAVLALVAGEEPNEVHNAEEDGSVTRVKRHYGPFGYAGRGFGLGRPRFGGYGGGYYPGRFGGGNAGRFSGGYPGAFGGVPSFGGTTSYATANAMSGTVTFGR